MKIIFLLRSLQRGGAERQCVILAKGLRKLGHDVGVVVFYTGGALHHELVDAGIPIESLEKRHRWDFFGFMWRLWSYVRKERPHILYSWLTVPNIIAVGVKLLVWRIRVVWGLRTASMELKYYDGLVRLSYRVEPWLSPLADLIIVNSQAGLRHARADGYDARRMTVIPNGIDAKKFAPDRSKGKALRAQWGVRDDEVLIGLVGRLDPIKDHSTFLRSAALLGASSPAFKFVCIGDGEPSYRASLLGLTEELGLTSRIVWAGECQDMPAAYNALDVACLTSIAEGFPNVVLEAMACGVPCVVSNVGDSAWIVDTTGVVVPPQDPEALAKGWSVLMHRLRLEPNLGAQARARVIEYFRVDTLVDTTHAALSGLYHDCRSC